ncbi:hypothetical protein ACEWY4_001485 [Coilia grayii]|uniref:HECT domain-containing protein n=1 Tax=Coilia grayii TaxID=363190 RepID=A0ABD1KT55_9TELE
MLTSRATERIKLGSNLLHYCTLNGKINIRHSNPLRPVDQQGKISWNFISCQRCSSSSSRWMNNCYSRRHIGSSWRLMNSSCTTSKDVLHSYSKCTLGQIWSAPTVRSGPELATDPVRRPNAQRPKSGQDPFHGSAVDMGQRWPRSVFTDAALIRRADPHVTQTCRVVVGLDLTPQQFVETLRSNVPNMPANFQLCRVNGQLPSDSTPGTPADQPEVAASELPSDSAPGTPADQQEAAARMDAFYLMSDDSDIEEVALSSPERAISDRDNLDSTTPITIVARRRHILRSACLALSRPYFKWHREPRIEFISEMADDYGGPRREFYRLLMREVQGSLGIFEGRPEDLFFTYDQRALADNKYFQAGKLTAWSLAHNGPGPRSMNKNLFMMMCGQKVKLSTMDISILLDKEQNQKMEELKNCETEEDLQRVKQSCGDWVAGCGVPTVYTAAMEDLPALIGQVVAHFSFHQVSSMIHQYIEGMDSCGNFWKMVARNYKAFLPVFTNIGEKLSRATLRAIFKPIYSDEGSNWKELEEDTMFSFERWLVAIEEGQSEHTLEEFLVFATGADHVPALGFPQDCGIDFYDQEPGTRRVPYASTCSQTVYLPRGVGSEEEFVDLMTLALKGSLGFGKV